LYQAILVRKHNQLHTVDQTELGQKVTDVRFDAALGEVQFSANSGIGVAPRHQHQNVVFPVGKVSKGLVARRSRWWEAASISIQ
jgi:hypothetical protein